MAGGEHGGQVSDEEILPSQTRPEFRISDRPDHSSQCSILCKLLLPAACCALSRTTLTTSCVSGNDEQDETGGSRGLEQWQSLRRSSAA